MNTLSSRNEVYPRTEPDGHTRGFRRIVVLMMTLITVPTAGLLAIGIVILSFTRAGVDIVLGVLVVSLVAVVVTGTVIVWYYVRREARLSQLQSDFVSKVGHDLRTPLTSIRMFVESLQRNSIPADQMEASLAALARETERLSTRIEQLLNWGGMEAGKRIYQLHPTPVGDIIDESVAAFRAQVLADAPTLELILPDKLPLVLADGNAIVDALVNLLENAYKYSTDERWIGIEVTVRGRWVCISVADRGIGIPAAEQRRIFQKFYRIDERLTQSEGSGLGLAIVRLVALAHQGRVEVESVPGRGSRFTMYLPMAEGSQP